MKNLILIKSLKLYLVNNKIGDNGIKYLFERIGNLIKINNLCLFLARNNITDGIINSSDGIKNLN